MKIEKSRQVFLDSCFDEKLREEIGRVRLYDWGWFPSDKCRYCGRAVMREAAEVASAYWKRMGGGTYWFVCHADCLKDGYAEEAHACQEVDADCNDCKHFRRVDGNRGECLKLGTPTTARPGAASAYKCFEHRKGSWLDRLGDADERT